ncbi:Protein ANTAGONIST OF LIKE HETEROCHROMATIN PROTEIN 1 [Bienertia sinuspersici]
MVVIIYVMKDTLMERDFLHHIEDIFIILEKYFNLRHAKARNVIEQCFVLLKGRWRILISPSWYVLQTHGCIVLAYALLHNLVWRYMPLKYFNDDDMHEEVHSDGDDKVMKIIMWST